MPRIFEEPVNHPNRGKLAELARMLNEVDDPEAKEWSSNVLRMLNTDDLDERGMIDPSSPIQNQYATEELGKFRSPAQERAAQAAIDTQPSGPAFETPEITEAIRGHRASVKPTGPTYLEGVLQTLYQADQTLGLPFHALDEATAPGESELSRAAGLATRRIASGQAKPGVRATLDAYYDRGKPGPIIGILGAAMDMPAVNLPFADPRAATIGQQIEGGYNQALSGIGAAGQAIIGSGEAAAGAAGIIDTDPVELGQRFDVGGSYRHYMESLQEAREEGDWRVYAMEGLLDVSTFAAGKSRQLPRWFAQARKRVQEELGRGSRRIAAERLPYVVASRRVPYSNGRMELLRRNDQLAEVLATRSMEAEIGRFVGRTGGAQESGQIGRGGLDPWSGRELRRGVEDLLNEFRAATPEEAAAGVESLTTPAAAQAGIRGAQNETAWQELARIAEEIAQTPLTPPFRHMHRELRARARQIEQDLVGRRPAVTEEQMRAELDRLTAEHSMQMAQAGTRSTGLERRIRELSRQIEFRDSRLPVPDIARIVPPPGQQLFEFERAFPPREGLAQVELFHYSPKERAVISTRYAGMGPFQGEEAIRYAEGAPGKTYWYRSGSKPEKRFESMVRHDYVGEARLYDIGEDHAGLVEASARRSRPGDMTEMESTLVLHGYDGYWNSAGPDPDIVAIFRDIQPTKVARKGKKRGPRTQLTFDDLDKLSADDADGLVSAGNLTDRPAFREKLKKAAGRARQRMKDRRMVGGERQGTLFMGVDPTSIRRRSADALDSVIILADELAGSIGKGAEAAIAGGRRFKAFVKEMVERHGDSAYGYVREAWEDAVTIANMPELSRGVNRALGEMFRPKYVRKGGKVVGIEGAPRLGVGAGSVWPITNSRQLTTIRGLIGQALSTMERQSPLARFWYELSGKAVLDMFGQNTDQARQFAGLLAIFSQGQQVSPNTWQALLAWWQHTLGQPVAVPTRVAGLSAKAAAWLKTGVFPDAAKVGPFFDNLMRFIDPAYRQGRLTVDRWIKRSFGFHPERELTTAQRAFLDNEIRALSADLGWEPHQVQAGIWVMTAALGDEATWAGKATKGVKPGEMLAHLWSQEADPAIIRRYSRNYGDHIMDHSAVVVRRSLPAKGGSFDGVRDLDLAAQTEYVAGLNQILLEPGTGQLSVLRELGVPMTGAATRDAVRVNAPFGEAFYIPVPKIPGTATADAGIAGVTQDALDQISGWLATVTDQSHVGWFRMRPGTGRVSDQSACLVRLANDTGPGWRSAKASELDAMQQYLRDLTGERFTPVWHPDGMMLLNHVERKVKGKRVTRDLTNRQTAMRHGRSTVHKRPTVLGNGRFQDVVNDAVERTFGHTSQRLAMEWGTHEGGEVARGDHLLSSLASGRSGALKGDPDRVLGRVQDFREGFADRHGLRATRTRGSGSPRERGPVVPLRQMYEQATTPSEVGIRTAPVPAVPVFMHTERTIPIGAIALPDRPLDPARMQRVGQLWNQLGDPAAGAAGKTSPRMSEAGQGILAYSGFGGTTRKHKGLREVEAVMLRPDPNHPGRFVAVDGRHRLAHLRAQGFAGSVPAIIEHSPMRAGETLYANPIAPLWQLLSGNSNAGHGIDMSAVNLMNLRRSGVNWIDDNRRILEGVTLDSRGRPKDLRKVPVASWLAQGLADPETVLGSPIFRPALAANLETLRVNGRIQNLLDVADKRILAFHGGDKALAAESKTRVFRALDRRRVDPATLNEAEAYYYRKMRNAMDYVRRQHMANQRAMGKTYAEGEMWGLDDYITHIFRDQKDRGFIPVWLKNVMPRKRYNRWMNNMRTGAEGYLEDLDEVRRLYLPTAINKVQTDRALAIMEPMVEGAWKTPRYVDDVLWEVPGSHHPVRYTDQGGEFSMRIDRRGDQFGEGLGTVTLEPTPHVPGVQQEPIVFPLLANPREGTANADVLDELADLIKRRRDLWQTQGEGADLEALDRRIKQLRGNLNLSADSKKIVYRAGGLRQHSQQRYAYARQYVDRMVGKRNLPGKWEQTVYSVLYDAAIGRFNIKTSMTNVIGGTYMVMADAGPMWWAKGASYRAQAVAGKNTEAARFLRHMRPYLRSAYIHSEHAGNVAGKTLRRARDAYAKVSYAPFNFTEGAVNRDIAALTYWSKGRDAGLTGQQLRNYVLDGIGRTQFWYVTATQPKFANHPLGRAMLHLNTYGVRSLNRILRDAAQGKWDVVARKMVGASMTTFLANKMLGPESSVDLTNVVAGRLSESPLTDWFSWELGKVPGFVPDWAQFILPGLARGTRWEDVGIPAVQLPFGWSMPMRAAVDGITALVDRVSGKDPDAFVRFFEKLRAPVEGLMPKKVIDWSSATPSGDPQAPLAVHEFGSNVGGVPTNLGILMDRAVGALGGEQRYPDGWRGKRAYTSSDQRMLMRALVPGAPTKDEQAFKLRRSMLKRQQTKTNERDRHRMRLTYAYGVGVESGNWDLYQEYEAAARKDRVTFDIKDIRNSWESGEETAAVRQASSGNVQGRGAALLAAVREGGMTDVDFVMAFQGAFPAFDPRKRTPGQSPFKRVSASAFWNLEKDTREELLKAYHEANQRLQSRRQEEPSVR